VLSSGLSEPYLQSLKDGHAIASWFVSQIEPLVGWNLKLVFFMFRSLDLFQPQAIGSFFIATPVGSSFQRNFFRLPVYFIGHFTLFPASPAPRRTPEKFLNSAGAGYFKRNSYGSLFIILIEASLSIKSKGGFFGLPVHIPCWPVFRFFLLKF